MQTHLLSNPNNLIESSMKNKENPNDPEDHFSWQVYSTDIKIINIKYQNESSLQHKENLDDPEYQFSWKMYTTDIKCINFNNPIESFTKETKNPMTLKTI